MKKKFCILVTKLTFGKVCFGWCVDPIKPKKEVKRYQADISFSMKATKSQVQGKIDDILMESF